MKSNKITTSTLLLMLLILSVMMSAEAMDQKKLDTLFLEAVVNGNLEEVKKHVSDGANLETKFQHGYTALAESALLKKNLEIFKFLIKSGANIESRSNTNHMTPLYFAIDKNNIKAVKILIRSKAKINIKSKMGMTPLMLSSRVGCTKSTKLLIKKNAYVNAQARCGNTALILARHPNIAKLLIQAGADITTRDNNNKTAFDIVTGNNNIKVAAYLLSIQNELENLIVNPFKDTTLASKSTYLKMLYHSTNLKNLSYVYATFHTTNKNDGLQLLIKQSNLSTFLNKEKQEKLCKASFFITEEEFKINKNFGQFKTLEYFDLMIQYL